jgi:sugar phosphate permease
MVQRLSTFSVSQVSLVSAIPYLVSIPIMLVVGWHSDRTGERRWHTAIPRLVSGAALTLCFFTSSHIWLSVVLLSLATVGFYSAHPGFWPLPNLFLGRTAAAASIGLINSFGNLGGFLGPYAVGWLSTKSGGFGPGLITLAACAYVSGLLVLFVRTSSGLLIRRNTPGT